MVTQSFNQSRRQFPTAERDPALMPREHGEKLIQEQDVQTKLLREILIELRALVELTAQVAALKADDYRKDV